MAMLVREGEVMWEGGDRAGVGMVGNVAYGHVGEGGGGAVGSGDRAGVKMVRNTAYGHVGKGVGASGDASVVNEEELVTWSM